MEKFTNVELVHGLRMLADFYESHQDMPLPDFQWFAIHATLREPFVDAVRLLADGGMVTKKTDSDTSIMKEHRAIRMFGPVKVEAVIAKSIICKKVRKMMMVDTYECPDSLLAEDMA